MVCPNKCKVSTVAKLQQSCILSPLCQTSTAPFFFFSCFLFQYPAALMNLGAILHLNGKLTEAEANYLRALQLKPDDVITQSNLRKLWNIMERQGLRTKRALGMQKGDV